MRKIDKYINYIKTVLVNKNIDNEITDWRSHAKLAPLSGDSSDAYIVDSLTLGMDASELLYLIRIPAETVDGDTASGIKRELEEKTEELVRKLSPNAKRDVFRSINLLFFVSSIHARVAIKEAFSPKNSLELLKRIRRITGVRSANLYPMFYLDKDVSSDEIKLPNVNRYEMVTLPSFDVDLDVPKEPVDLPLKGYVFTANLFDLVALYNTIGDQLFNKNVRLGIEDKLDVDRSIKETLADKPEAFWFRNNGVTVLVEGTHMKLDRVNEIVLKGADRSELRFSVINGAQTITAAAEYYYALPAKKRAAEASIAKVLVRIIQIRDTDQQCAEKEAKAISVALNRQKPIKAEDLAFTSEFVETMNIYLESSREPYTLVRRGEELASGGKACSLIDFAKARKACAGDPGAARSLATSTLLRISSDTSRFQDQEIFKHEWYSASESERKALYRAFYSPIPFAVDMKKDCQSIAKRVQRSDAVGSVMKHGMWYFIAYTAFVLNDRDDRDYSRFSYSADKIQAQAFCRLFEEFAELYCERLGTDAKATGSGAFKTSEHYRRLKEFDFSGTAFYRSVCKLFGKKEPVSFDGKSRPAPSDSLT